VEPVNPRVPVVVVISVLLEVLLASTFLVLSNVLGAIFALLFGLVSCFPWQLRAHGPQGRVIRHVLAFSSRSRVDKHPSTTAARACRRENVAGRPILVFNRSTRIRRESLKH